MAIIGDSCFWLVNLLKKSSPLKPLGQNEPKFGGKRPFWLSIFKPCGWFWFTVLKKMSMFNFFICFWLYTKKNILQFYTVLHQVVFRYSINAHTWTSLIIYHCPDLSSLCQVLHMWKAMFCFVLTCSEIVTVHSDDTFL